MEKFEECKMFLLEHKTKFIIGGGILILIVGLFFGLIITSNLKRQGLPEKQLTLEKEKEEEEEQEKKEDHISLEPKEETKTCHVWVDIKGEVIHPGLYEMNCDDRVADAINKAGGKTTKSDTSNINLGKKLFDEMVIIVETKKESATNTNTTPNKNSNMMDSNSTDVTSKEDIHLPEEITNGNTIKNDASITEADKNTNSSINSGPIDDDGYLPNVSLNMATLEELMKLPGIGESKAKLIIEYRNTNGSFQSIEEVMNVKGIGTKIFEKIEQYLTL